MGSIVNKMSRTASFGFALPTILIASLIMLTVLLVSITTTSSVRVALLSQHYDELSEKASESGLTYAETCLDANNGVSRWSNAKPLRPDTDCTGTQLPSCPVSPTDADCHFVMSNKNLRTTFSVGLDQSPPPASWKKVAAGWSFECAIASDDNVYCWGYNGYGQLGNGSTRNKNVPTKIRMDNLQGKTIKDISAGSNQVCVIASDDNAYCWGNNPIGQLGNKSTLDSSIPVPVYTGGALKGLKLKSIVSGADHSCVIASDNNVYCWGNNYNGQLGDNTWSTKTEPVAVNTANGVSELYGLTVKSIDAGRNHNCVIASDNKVYCWGNNYYGQLGNNDTFDQNVPVAVITAGSDMVGKTAKYDASRTTISAGQNHSCVIANEDSYPYCWGLNYNGQIGNSSWTNSLIPEAVTMSGVLSGKTVKSIENGGYNTCAIASDDNAYCWGYGYYGGLGNSENSNYSSPQAITTTGALSGKTMLSMSGGYYHVCAIASDNLMYCWGYNYYAQLGNNSTINANAAVAVINDGVVLESLTSVGKSSLLRSSDKSTWRQYTQTNRKNLLEHISKGWFLSQKIEVGHYHSCGINLDNLAYCWGGNTRGQLGANSVIDYSYPFAVNTASGISGLYNMTVISIDAGDRFSCVKASDNNAYCWGQNDNGQIGDNSWSQRNAPVAVNITSASALYQKTVKDISVGFWHVCVIANEDNKVYCWGYNYEGELGIGTSGSGNDKNLPVAVITAGSPMDGKNIAAISAGGYHTCAVDTVGVAYCWGQNDFGQLGNGTSGGISAAPVQVTGALSGKVVVSISAGRKHTCAVTTESKAYCWGINLDGQLGINSTSPSYSPVEINMTGALSGKTVKSIYAGFYHVCAIASDDKAYCWGDSLDGQLGNDTTNDSLVPVAVYTNGALFNKTITSMSVGSGHTCAISSDNRTYCWGSNINGFIGDNTTIRRLTPVSVLTIVDYDPFSIY